LIYSNLVIVFLAGTAFVYFANMKWKLKILRDFTLIVLFCGLLFSAVNVAADLKNSDPNTAVVNSMIWLKLNADEGSVVFSHHSNGFWIEFIAGQPVVLDGLFEHTPDAADIYFDSMQALDTNDLDIARQLLSKHDVKYILITKDMRDGLVWDKEGRGLDFLLSNVETFKKVQENSYVSVYEYIYRGS
jgi:asparagine N-glycosylation enzyme membrane subunit Stt3